MKIDGLLVAGRCISGTHRAHASYRVMSICLAMGQAAGVAAALSAKEKDLFNRSFGFLYSTILWTDLRFVFVSKHRY